MRSGDTPRSTEGSGGYLNIEVTTQEGLNAYRAAIERDTVLAFDTETESLDCRGDAFMQIGGCAGDAYYVDKRRVHPDLWRDFGQASLSGVRPVLCHNAPFDLMKMRMGLGIRYLGRVHDTRISSHLYDENTSHRLKDLAEARWPGSNANEQAVKDWLKKHNGGKPNYDKVPVEIMHPYACQDVVLTRKLHDELHPKVYPPLYDTECELVKVLVDMRITGVRVDVPYLKSLIPAFESRMETLEKQIHIAAGCEFKVGSDPQLADVLYKMLGLPIKILTEKGGPSTDKEALASIEHPIGKLILEWRDKETSLNTFILPWLEAADGDGYLHPSLNQCGTRSSRFSCSDPNCLSPDTEILTSSGFKNMESYGGEPVAAYNQNTGEIEFQIPDGIYISDEKQHSVVEVKNTHLDWLLTEDHRCFVRDRKTGKTSIVSARTLPKDCHILHGAKFNSGKFVEYSEAFLRLMVAAQADAEISYNGVLRFRFKKSRKYSRLKDILAQGGFKYSTRKNKMEEFLVCCPEILGSIGRSKTFPTTLLQLPPHLRAVFLDELFYWDGCYTTRSQYCSCNEDNVDLVQALFALDGVRAHKNSRFLKTSRSRNYTIDITKRDYSLTTNALIKKYTSTTRVWCVRVPAGLILARRGSDTFITGNCQQIPKRSESAALLRRAFIYPDGRVGGTTDQSQIEMVGFAHYSKDPVMIKALQDGVDLHKSVVVEMGMADCLENVTKDQRRLGKGTNFSIVFGVGKGKLSAYLSSDQYAGRYVSPTEANEIRMKYRAKFPSVVKFQEAVAYAIKTRPDHAVKNAFGRVFHLDPEKAYIGVNRIVQGWAGDMAKWGMVQAWKAAQGTDLRLYLNIHDALNWHCKPENFREHAMLIDKCLTQCPHPLRVPIRTETTFSRTNWAEEEVYAV